MKTLFSLLLIIFCCGVMGQTNQSRITFNNGVTTISVPRQNSSKCDTVWMPNNIYCNQQSDLKWKIEIDTTAFNKALYDSLKMYRGIINSQKDYIEHLKRQLAIDAKYDAQIKELIKPYSKKQKSKL